MSAGRMEETQRLLEALLQERQLADLPDSQLLERFVRQRDEEAFAVLLQRHGPMVLGVCRCVLRHTEDAEDAFQATFLVLACKARQIRRPDSLASWLYGTAYRVALKARTRAARRQAVERTRAQMQPHPPGPGPEEQGAVGDWLHLELSRLPERDRQVLVLCYLEGRTQEQTARALGCPAGSISRHLQRACELLRERLTSRGVVLSVPALAGLALPGRVLSAEQVQAALYLVTTSTVEGVLAARQTGAALDLAREVLQTMTAAKLKALVALLLLVGLIAAGTLLADPHRAPSDNPKAPAAAGGPLPIRPGQEPAELLDRHGDPLPPGAVTRLGTTRLRPETTRWRLSTPGTANCWPP